MIMNTGIPAETRIMFPPIPSHPIPCCVPPVCVDLKTQRGETVSLPAPEGAWRAESSAHRRLRGGAGARLAGLHEGTSPGHRAQVFQHDRQLHLQSGGGGGFYRPHGPSPGPGRRPQRGVGAGRESAPARRRPGRLWGNVPVLLGSSDGLPGQVSDRWREGSRGGRPPRGRRKDVCFLVFHWTQPGWTCCHNDVVMCFFFSFVVLVFFSIVQILSHFGSLFLPELLIFLLFFLI